MAKHILLVDDDALMRRSLTFNLEQFTRVNGSDTQSNARMQQLELELSDLELKKDCILTNNPLCD